ncbi:unnamed protein product [Phytophthora fragariaefolia]|uniref:Unnamed protein product n=1 Tax=Phytophthora fragariaefolia TaxID=1490495 RepID=A0A9W7D038_9STRA|nr:unnamed protein product [Phytophthora fragariaefolia]
MKLAKPPEPPIIISTFEEIYEIYFDKIPPFLQLVSSAPYLVPSRYLTHDEQSVGSPWTTTRVDASRSELASGSGEIGQFDNAPTVTRGPAEATRSISVSGESNAATTSPAWSTTATAGVGSPTTATAMSTVRGGDQPSSLNGGATTRMTGTATVADDENTVSMGTRRSTRRRTGTPMMAKQTRDTNPSVVQEQHERRGDVGTRVEHCDEQAALIRRSQDEDETVHANDETRPLERTTKPLATMRSGARREQAAL